VAVSHALARRDLLRRDLEAAVRRSERLGVGGAGRIDALVVELKAAAVDVVTRWGVERGIEVIYLDNRPQVVDGGGSLDELLVQTAEAARERFGR
jgi:cyclic 2,3-diphosphoglycerate synthetase